MNAVTPIKADNLAIWNALGKTDPAHTKQFSRAGGFKGTALKPIWVERQLTDLFGPVGIGWGMGEPTFQIVVVGEETLVYCTVTCWHTSPVHTFVGVGGDKVASKRRDGGVFADDEAFKKAFTDAIMNAFKHVGAGADIHMGQFDDSKYVREVAREFAAQEAAGGQGQGDSQGEVSPRRRGENWGGRYPTLTAMRAARVEHHAELERLGNEGTFDDLDGYLTSPEYVDYVAIASERFPSWLEGQMPEGAPPEYIQTFKLEQKARDLIALRGNIPAGQE